MIDEIDEYEQIEDKDSGIQGDNESIKSEELNGKK